MATQTAESYPRPDFVRSGLRWTSLNGPWNFLFDDEDKGLASQWHLNGLPESVTVQNAEALSNEEDSASASESITAKIAANTQNLIKGNLTLQNREARTYKRQDIIVPFVFQSSASGLNERGVHEVLWYERNVTDLRSSEEKSKGHRLVIRFGAVDYEAKVWINGQFVGGHRGGHVPFDLDISDAVHSHGRDEHRLTLRVYDSAYDLTQPRGKQYWGAKPESIFYTPSGGIWQNVWLESVPSARLADSSHGTILRNNDIEDGVLHSTVVVLGRLAGHSYSVEIEAKYHDMPVRTSERKRLPRDSNMVNIDIDLRLPEESLKSTTDATNPRAWKSGLALWSPEFPQLYDLKIRLFSGNALLDEIKTHTGMRSLDWTSGKSILTLNNQPLFQSLFLDQGYWAESFMTPPSARSLKEDIEAAKAMGFNGCRKHQKVEDPAFLYWADKLGYLVWGEMANAYSFSNEYVDRMNQEWMEAVRRDINHPCIVAWTPVNESWAYTDLKGSVEQRNHIRSLYYMTKTLDPTRPINDNCGWEHVQTDLTTFHDYADSPELTKTCSSLSGILGPKAGRPMFSAPIPGLDPGCSHKEGAVVICTEFGGVNIALGKSEADEWGYTTASNADDLLERVEKLVSAVVDGGFCAGFVWTQFADIEQETNGLYSFDRKEKLQASKVKAVVEGAMERYYKRVGKLP